MGRCVKTGTAVVIPAAFRKLCALCKELVNLGNGA